MILKGNFSTQQVWLDGKEITPDKSLQYAYHSPDGFMWAYAGSGPAQLALAVCLELFEEKEALKVYQKFKDRVIARLPNGNFEIDLYDAMLNIKN